MNIEEASNLINKVPKGFRVRYGKIKSCFLGYGQFPEDSLIPHEELAWTWAKLIADAAKGEIVDLYVIDDRGRPVDGYEKRKIVNR